MGHLLLHRYIEKKAFPQSSTLPRCRFGRSMLLTSVPSKSKMNDWEETGLFCFQNFLLAYDSLNDNLPHPLRGKLNFLTRENQITRNLGYLQLSRPRTKTVTYGTKSILSKATDFWNCINRTYHSELLHTKSRNVCKNFIKEMLLAQY